MELGGTEVPKPTGLAKEGVWTADAPKPAVPYFVTARDDSGALVAAEVHLPGIKAAK